MAFAAVTTYGASRRSTARNAIAFLRVTVPRAKCSVRHPTNPESPQKTLMQAVFLRTETQPRPKFQNKRSGTLYSCAYGNWVSFGALDVRLLGFTRVWVWEGKTRLKLGVQRLKTKNAGNERPLNPAKTASAVAIASVLHQNAL